MKKLFAFFFLFGLSHLSSAQISQGTLMTGGNFELNYQSGSKTSVTSFALAPTAGLFLVENMGIGASVGYYSQASKYDGNSTGSSSSFYISPFTRYYFSGNAFGQFDIPINLTNNASYIFGSKLKLGYDIFVTNAVAIEPGVYAGFYFGTNPTINSPNDNLKYQFLSAGIDISFQIFLNKN
jgi:hypothetical protein